MKAVDRWIVGTSFALIACGGGPQSSPPSGGLDGGSSDARSTADSASDARSTHDGSSDAAREPDSSSDAESMEAGISDGIAPESGLSDGTSTNPDSGDAGDASPLGDDSGDSDAGCRGPITGKLTRPNSLISRGKQTFSSPGGGSAVVDGAYHNGGWTAGTPSVAKPSWVAIKLGSGPTRLLVSIDDGGTYNYQDPDTSTVYGFPADYQIEVSNTSTNGNDGTWTSVTEVTGNMVRTRAHSFDFTGQSWIKLVITAAPPNISTNGVQIGEIDVHDVSSTGAGCLPEDTWFFMGDSITAFAYDREQDHQPSFAAGVNTSSSSFFPAMINGGIGGEKSSDGLARLSQVLALNPDYRFFALSYGTNDAAGDQVSTATFQSNMQSMITMVEAAGRIPVIPHIPFSGDGNHGDIPQYDAVIDTLNTQNQLTAGPDLYTFFMTNQSTLFTCGCTGGRATDNLHPNDVGLKDMNSLWTTAMLPLYP